MYYNKSMAFKEIKGIKTYYEKSGKKGDSVLLLHGWGQNTEMMAYIASFLSKHFVVYNLDLPGFGKTEEPSEPWDIDAYTKYIRSFCENFKIDNPIIIGHSFGCRIAFKYALNYPVKRMVLTGAAGIRGKRGVEYYTKVYGYKLAKKVLSLKPFEKQKEKLMKNAGSDDYKNTSGIMRSTFVKVVNEDLKPILKDIKTPTLLVWGENDEPTPLSMGKTMEKLMGDATLVIFENDDHFAYFHQGDRFNRVLEAYLKDLYA